MAEGRRITFETVRSLSKEKKPKEVQPTYRFSLVLGETNDNTCPEYSYSELVKTARGAEQQNDVPPLDDPYGDADDDEEKLREIARKFEEKYNYEYEEKIHVEAISCPHPIKVVTRLGFVSPADGFDVYFLLIFVILGITTFFVLLGPKIDKKKRKNRGKLEDYIDRGMGYDETDPFIDNEEAYDELVPSTLTTQYGGFYINFGELEFKNLSDSDSDFQDEKKHKRKRKHKEGGEKEVKRKRKTIRDGDHVMQKKRGRKPLDKSLSALHKPKKRGQTTVADLLQQQRLQQQQQPPPPPPPQQPQQPQPSPLPQPPVTTEEAVVAQEEHADSPSPACSSPMKPSGDSSVEGPCGVVQVQPTVPAAASVPAIATVRDVIEAVIKGAGSTPVNNGSTAMLSSSSSDSEGNVQYVVESIDAPKLPENLPSDLGDVVTKLKQAAFMSDEGKCKFFSGDVNKMLLSIELMSRELPCAHRSMIFAHLASYLPCTKETLLKRAKKLRLDQEDGKLYAPKQRLKDAITDVMPEMIAKYAASCQSVSESKSGDVEEENPASGSDAEEDSQDPDGKKPSLLPKKKFEWNDEIRELLCEVVRIKLKCYEVMKMRTQSAEDYIRQFLDSDVKPLWPPGWMHTSCKPKKAFLMPKKLVMTSAPGTPKPVLGSPLPELTEQPVTPITVKSVITQVTSSIPATPSPIITSTDSSVVASSATQGGSLDTNALINSVAQATSVITSAVQSCLTVADPPEVQIPVTKAPVSATVSVVANPQASLQESLPARMESAIKMEQARKQDSSLKVVEQSKRQELGIKTEQSKKSEPFSDVILGSPEKSRTSCVTTSPNKRFFRVNSTEASPISPLKVSPQSSIASQMLDRIICASLGNFPNSGTSSVVETSTLSNRILGSSPDADSRLLSSLKLPPSSSSPLTSSSPTGGKQVGGEIKPSPYSSRTDAQKSSPASLAVAPGTSGISILKSSYSPNQPSTLNHLVAGQKEDPVRTSANISSLSRSSISPVTSVPTSSSVPKVKQVTSVPCLRYGFEEAFIKTLEGHVNVTSHSTTGSSQPSSTSVASSKVSLPKYDLSVPQDDVGDEPVNFSSSRTTSVVNSQYGSHERLRYAGSVQTSVLSVASEKSSRSQPSSVQYGLNPIRSTRTSPESLAPHPESSKGFSLPSSVVSTSSSQSVVRFPPPAHSSFSSQRTSISQQQESGTTTAQCHSSPSQSPSHNLSTTSASGQFQATPLSHFTSEPSHSRHLVQNPWRGSTPSPTTNYQSHAQYSSSSSVHASDNVANQSSLQHTSRTSPSAVSTGHILVPSQTSSSPCVLSISSRSSPIKTSSHPQTAAAAYIHGSATVVTMAPAQQSHRSTPYSSQQYSSSSNVINLPDHQNEGSSQQVPPRQHLQ